MKSSTKWFCLISRGEGSPRTWSSLWLSLFKHKETKLITTFQIWIPKIFGRTTWFPHIFLKILCSRIETGKCPVTYLLSRIGSKSSKIANSLVSHFGAPFWSKISNFLQALRTVCNAKMHNTRIGVVAIHSARSPWCKLQREVMCNWKNLDFKSSVWTNDGAAVLQSHCSSHICSFES